MKAKLPGISLFDLTGKNAIVTGGSQGLGLAMAEGLASAGANIAIVNRNEQKGIAAVERIKELYGVEACLLYTSPSPRDQRGSRMPSSA